MPRSHHELDLSGLVFERAVLLVDLVVRDHDRRDGEDDQPVAHERRRDAVRDDRTERTAKAPSHSANTTHDASKYITPAFSVARTSVCLTRRIPSGAPRIRP